MAGHEVASIIQASAAKAVEFCCNHAELKLCSHPKTHPFSILPYSRYLILMQLRGCGTALVTPFHQDGSLDEQAFKNFVSWQIESGIDFLVHCGTTGETPTLTHDEWLRVIDVTIEVTAGRGQDRFPGSRNRTRAWTRRRDNPLN